MCGERRAGRSDVRVRLAAIGLSNSFLSIIRCSSSRSSVWRKPDSSEKGIFAQGSLRTEHSTAGFCGVISLHRAWHDRRTL
jgi:hypothetical protein